MAHQIFVSSKQTEFATYRKKIAEVIVQKRWLFEGMEDWPAEDPNARAASLARVRNSHVFVVIVGDDDQLAIVEAEYRCAREEDLPCLAYFKSGTRSFPFKDELKKNHTFREFSSADELAVKVLLGI